MDTAHFLLTRFNVPLGNVPVNLGLQDDWLEHRFALFENFCLPSVLAQENKDFCWLLWIDERTPERWQARLKADLMPLAASKIFTVKPGAGEFWHGDMERVARESSAQRILTTRLDNDDAISKDYLAAVARRAAQLPEPGRYYVINFRHGCQVSRDGFFYSSEWLNPFLSVVSPPKPLITAWHGNHAGMKQFGKVLDSGFFDGRMPYWLQAIHGNNVANHLHGGRIRLEPRHLARFSLGENWMRLLQNESFAPARAEVLLVQFPYRRAGQDAVCEIVMSGPKGEYLFENVRREMTFHKGDLLQFTGFVMRGVAPGLMIDVGANIGNHTLFFAKVLSANVLCVEPNPAALELLKSNVALNGLADRVAIVEAAASDAPGSGQLRTASLLNLGATTVLPYDGGNVKMSPLDELLAKNERKEKVSLIKIAVEGFENRVLRGALQTIRDCRPVLVVEAATTQALHEIEETLRPFHYAKAGPFCETTYVFSTNRMQLWEALLQRRLFRTTSRVKRKMFKSN